VAISVIAHTVPSLSIASKLHWYDARDTFAPKRHRPVWVQHRADRLRELSRLPPFTDRVILGQCDGTIQPICVRSGRLRAWSPAARKKASSIALSVDRTIAPDMQLPSAFATSSSLQEASRPAVSHCRPTVSTDDQRPGNRIAPASRAEDVAQTFRAGRHEVVQSA
jgi:hypothetical protein